MRKWVVLAGIAGLLAMSVRVLPAQHGFTGVDRVDATAFVVVPVDTTITIRSTGTNLEFLPARISAKQGMRITVRYVNEGTLPHNFVVVKDEADIDTLGRAAFEAKDTDYVPLQHESMMIAHSALAAPGETVEVTFVMPPPGEYFFVCLYSGHYNMMVGTLRSLN